MDFQKGKPRVEEEEEVVLFVSGWWAELKQGDIAT